MTLDERPPGRVLYEVLSGSHAYGVATPDSDRDVRGVFLLPSDDLLGLDTPKTTWERRSDDQVFWEVGHFCRLLVKGNPNIVGMLFTPEDCVISRHPAIDGLLAMRDRFLSSSMLDAYMGWIRGESEALARGYDPVAKRSVAYPFKRLSHVPRLIWELTDVLTTGTMSTRLSPPRQLLVRAIKSGEASFIDTVAECGDMLIGLDELIAQVDPLPEPPVEEARAWLLETRHRFG